MKNNFPASGFNHVLSPKHFTIKSDAVSLDPSKIFIVEAEQIIALDLMKMLQKAAYQPIIIKQKDDIFTLLTNVNPALLIISSDLKSEILTKLLTFVKDLNTSIIILSTQSDYTINRYLRTYNPNYIIISKPFTEDELLQSIPMCLKCN